MYLQQNNQTCLPVGLNDNPLSLRSKTMYIYVYQIMKCWDATAGSIHFTSWLDHVIC